jgi:tRNA threonylcarbamoyladenosine biosynthesis protein TsaB
MTGPLILHIETATDVCSVSISEKERLLAMAESGPERSHAVLLNKYIRKVCGESGKELKDLDAVSVSKGPGSYTGLRIGVSTAKGLAYALEIPIIATGTLDHMAFGAREHPKIAGIIRQYGEQVLLCPMLDARRMEVYSGVYTSAGTMEAGVSAVIIEKDSYQEFLHEHHLCFFGNGAEKCRTVLDHPHAHFIEGIHPSSAHMVIPGLRKYHDKQFEDVAYFEPFYLKEFLATKPRKKT